MFCHFLISHAWGEGVRAIRWVCFFIFVLQVLEGVEGEVEGALVAGILARETVEVCKQAGIGWAVAVEQAGFGPLKTVHVPDGGNDLKNQEALSGADGAVVGLEFTEESVEFGDLFERDGGVLGGQAMLEGIEPDSRLALRGSGAGGVLGVAAVGREFGCADHGFLAANGRE